MKQTKMTYYTVIKVKLLERDFMISIMVSNFLEK